MRSEVEEMFVREVASGKVFVDYNELQELRKDAARYRWLRKSVSNPAYPAQSAQYGVRMIYGEELDAAIDAALSKAGVKS